jgi:hypothetical protein
MRYYLIKDKEDNIVILNGITDIKIVKTTIDRLKKHFNLIQYLITDKETAEHKREVYSEISKEKLEIMEIDIELSVIKLNDFKDIMNKIAEEKISIFNLREEAIESFIDYYSKDMEDTIFYEFARHIDETKSYTETLIEYIEKEYSDRILEINGLFFLYYNDYLTEDEIKKIAILSSNKTKNELINFCKEGI